jgi:two-component system, OmpR family, response regulator
MSCEQRDVPAKPDVRRELVRVLVVDTDVEMRSQLTGYLERHRMSVTPVADGDAMWAVLRHQAVDLLILEINLRDMDGLSLCRMLRANSQIPIMLTGSADHVDPIVGFEFGADAYIAKPYDVREILARAKGILRRMKGVVRSPYLQGVHSYRFSGWILDGVSRTLHGPNAERVRLRRSEHRLLATLLANPNAVVPREVLKKVAEAQNNRGADVCVSRLRSILGDDGHSPRIIKTVYGEGYTVAVAVEALQSCSGTVIG